jgi:epoxyqueuosine reductase
VVVSSEIVKTQALKLGFNLVGITPAVASPWLAAYERWVEAGMHGSMNYMARPDRMIRRRDLNSILPNVQSVVIVGLDYQTGVIDEALLNDPRRGRIASYAWGLDYHDILTPRLEAFGAWLLTQTNASNAARVYVDTGAILERSHGQQAGLGFIGKNTMLIHPRRGSTFFLGEILTTLEFDRYDLPGRETMCGGCTRCLMACPTNAFPQPYVLDARRCISYLTIEHKGSIDLALRPLMGNWVFGCDVCQEVCPFQRFATPSQERAFFPTDAERAAPHLVDLLALDAETFRRQYYGSPIYRIKHERMIRNACVAAGNSGDTSLMPILTPLLQHTNPLIRGHAAWGFWRLNGQKSSAALETYLHNEMDIATRMEVESFLTHSAA